MTRGAMFGGWHQSAIDVLLEAGMGRGFLGLAVNEHGVEIAVYRCPACGEPHTACPVPAMHPDNELCNQVECPEYDPDRDVEELLRRGYEVRPDEDE